MSQIQAEPIRILHIVTNMSYGGLENLLMNYYRNIDRTKIQFDFLTHFQDHQDFEEEIRDLGGRLFHLPRLNPFDLRYLAKLNRFFADHPEYKIVHSHLDCMAGLPLKVAKKYGIPARIAHAHSSNQTKDAKYLLKLWFKRNIRKFATDLFACSSDAGKWMLGTDNFRVLNNAIDAAAYRFDPLVRAQVRQELGIAADTFVIGHVGRFAPPKNHNFLVEIVKETVERSADTRGLLVGEGELRPAVEAKVKTLDIGERVVFAGLRSDVSRMLQAMDVFVFPSIYEGLPVSLVEAQAAGLPCLISDKVPIECKKTDLVTQIPLAAGAARWAEAVLAAANRTRENTLEEIKASGFDIEENARWLTNFYLNLQGKKG